LLLPDYGQQLLLVLMLLTLLLLECSQRQLKSRLL
jgi:hypothetical protein